MVVEDINFLDMACLLKIGPDTVMERFGGLINTSFFDASTIAGTLKQKGLIEFTNDYPGPNGILVTTAGKTLITEAETKSAEPFDALDSTILVQMSGGKRLPFELANSLTLRGRDLAFRLYKLYKQNYIIYDLKNGGVELLLTESGFLKVREVQPNMAPNIGQQKAAAKAAGIGPIEKMLQGNAQPQQDPNAKKGMGRLPLIIVAIIVIVVVVVLAKKYVLGG
ncbi:MAG: hypothetical protein KGH53_02290 [Candidatus Micrarchaeota archaeon]|nr:hypothetical protein [Candidatus Micrarchaeota archaeon]